MAKMIMLVYNEAIEQEVMEMLGACCLKNYTKIIAIFGRGNTSGIHLGNDIWPGRNNLLYVACEDKQSKEVMAKIKELRKELGYEGIKAFILPIEEIS